PGGFRRGPAAAALLAALVSGQVHGFGCRDEDEQSPQVVAVVQLGEPAPGQALAEAVEGAQGDVFFVRRPPGYAAELLAGEAAQGAEVAPREGLGGGMVARPELAQPVRHRAGGRHRVRLATIEVLGKATDIVVPAGRACQT